MPDQFNLSGDFRGSFINIKSTLTNVQQSIGEISAGDEDTRKQLEELIAQLSDALQQVPAGEQEGAEAVAETAKSLVEAAKAEKPNKVLLQITGEGLKKAAHDLVRAAPVVVHVASQIVDTVLKLTGTR
jgi:methyl-accepting chemotaxis protein